MSDKLDLILEKLNAIETNQQRQEEVLTQLLKITGATNEKVATIQEEVAKIKGEITEIKENQSRHETILEKLALRSIEHEVKLERIK